MLTLALATVALADIIVWESEEPIEVDITHEMLGDSKNIISYDQLNGALNSNDIGKMVDGHGYHAPANEDCWHHKRPASCPRKGYVKYEKVPFAKARIGKARVEVGADNAASLVIANVSMQIPPTKMKMQPKGLFTIPCDGLITGVIHGAAAAVQGVIDLAADGVPILGQASATPIDGAIVQLEHQLVGICGMIESLVDAVLSFCNEVIQNVLGSVLPNLVQGLLGDLVGAIPLPAPGNSLNMKLE